MSRVNGMKLREKNKEEIILALTCLLLSLLHPLSLSLLLMNARTEKLQNI